MLSSVYFMSWIPLAMMSDVATTSTRCDDLMSELNNMRVKFGKESHENILWLDTALRGLNKSGGLGFVVGGPSGIVLDRRKLRLITVELVGGLFSLLTFLFAFKTNTHMAGSDSCSLSSAQAATIRSAAQLALGNSTGTCSYNLTIDEVLAL